MMFFYKLKGHTTFGEASCVHQVEADQVFPETLAYKMKIVYLDSPNEFLED